MKKFIKDLIRETLLTEVDWEDTFSDVKRTCVNPKKIVDYLNDVRANKGLHTKDRQKFSKGMPYIHAKSSFYKGNEDLDIDYFIKQITAKPNNLINTNDKILKTGGHNEFVYKTGLPAFRGIVYDMNKEEFSFIETCPGAGECVSICYALKGKYIIYPVSYDSMTRRLNFLLNDPDGYEQQLYEELKQKCVKHKALEGYKNKVLLRWNDSGDFFTKRYVSIAKNVMDNLKAEGYNIDSYAYTKMGDVATKDSGFQTTFSAGANKKQSDKVDTSKNKMSVVVPKQMFKDLNLMKFSDEKILKDRIASEFGFDVNTILTYDEMMQTPKGELPKWNIIVTTNDGDDAGFRKDVRTILLTQH
jgi:hypothetical protein